MTLFRQIALTCCLIAASNASLPADEDWTELFNGKDLTGWEANVLPESFSVVDDSIRAHCKDTKLRSHLFTTTGPWRNFELEAVVRGEPGANSGIFFHTDREVRDDRLHLTNGYEVQLNSSPKEKRRTGSLYAIVDLAESPVDETEWFTLRLRVEGSRIQVFLNDESVVDYTEPENPERPPNRKGRVLRKDGGQIALQAHDPESTFYFRQIRIRELP